MFRSCGLCASLRHPDLSGGQCRAVTQRVSRGQLWSNRICCITAQASICKTLQSSFCGVGSHSLESTWGSPTCFFGGISLFQARPSHSLHPHHSFAREGCYLRCCYYICLQRNEVRLLLPPRFLSGKESLRPAYLGIVKLRFHRVPRNVHISSSFFERRSSAQLKRVLLAASGPADTVCSRRFRWVVTEFASAHRRTGPCQHNFSFSSVLWRMKKWRTKIQGTQQLISTRFGTPDGECAVVNGAWPHFLGQVKTQLLALCQVFPSHGKWMCVPAAAWAPTVGERDEIRRALAEQPDWDDRALARTRCSRPRLRQISPTQPTSRRATAPPTALGLALPVKSPPPNFSGGTAPQLETPQISHFCRAPSCRNIQSQEGFTESCAKPFSSQATPSWPFFLSMTENQQSCGQREQPEE